MHLILFIVLSLFAHAESPLLFLTAEDIKLGAEFLPDPPPPDSPTDKEDLRRLKQIHDDFASSRLKGFQCEIIKLEAPLKMPEPFLAPLGPLTNAEYEKLKSLSSDIFYSTNPILKSTKAKFKRRRPYLRDSSHSWREVNSTEWIVSWAAFTILPMWKRVKGWRILC